MTESVPPSSTSRFCSETGARTTYWARASRVLVEVAGIRMLASTLKPLWVQLEHVLREPLVQELALQEEGDHPLTEAAAHLLEIDRGDVDEPALRVEASLEEQAVPVGMEPAEGSRRLEYEDTGAVRSGPPAASVTKSRTRA